MRTYSEYERVLDLWECGYNPSEIARRTGIPRPTVRDCIKKFGNLEYFREEARRTWLFPRCEILKQKSPDNAYLREQYAYVLGLYLGDGSISRIRKTLRLRITLDARYPQIIQRCASALQVVLPGNKVGTVCNWVDGRLSSVNVSVWNNQLITLFPQHGEGVKHDRPIILEDWQQEIVDAYPLEFFRGLYHSDGSRYDNVINGKAYPRYQFTNASADIIRLFCLCCDRLSLHWTQKSRVNPHSITTDIYISKRADVEMLDRLIGAKA